MAMELVFIFRLPFCRDGKRDAKREREFQVKGGARSIFHDGKSSQKGPISSCCEQIRSGKQEKSLAPAFIPSRYLSAVYLFGEREKRRYRIRF